jgi:predicted O-methyltransferase YrrM
VGLKQLLPGGARRWLRRAKRSFLDIVTRPNLYNLRSPHRVGVVYTAPSDMKIEERLMLYSFIRGFQPQRALEIGVLRGGSGLIIANAMEDNGKGVVIGIDPDPLLDVRRSAFHGRYRLIRSTSPEALPQARELAGGPFDFVLIDGLHLYKQVSRDIEGVLPHLQDDAYVMFHDAFHYGVGTAIPWRHTLYCAIAVFSAAHPSWATIRSLPIMACGCCDMRQSRRRSPIKL